MREISIRDWRDLPEKKNGVAVVFDIFRCSTTLQCLLSHRTDEVWVARQLDGVKSLAGEFKIFSELPEDLSCRARYDNSPAKALADENQADAQSPFLVVTTSGTPAMFAARSFEEVWVGALTNFSSIVQLLSQEERSITLIPAAKPSSDDLEDGIVAQEIAIALDGYCMDEQFVSRCGERCIQLVQECGRVEYLTEKLPTGKDDMKISMDLNRFSFVPQIKFEPAGRLPGLARAVRINLESH